MSNRNYDQRPESDLFLDEPQDAGGGSHGLHLHAMLRGRYHWAVILGLVLGVLCALAGFFSQGEVYRSTSLIAISPISQSIIDSSGDDSIARFFDPWVQRQLAIMSGPKVLEPAMNSDEWQSAAAPYGETFSANPAMFQNGLALGHQRGQQVIEISYESPIPELAQVGANVIAKTYMNELERSEQQTASQRQSVLENLRLDLERRIQKLKADKSALTTEHTDLTLADELKRMTEIRDQLERDLEDTRLELAQLGVNTEGDDTGVENLSVEQLGLQNPQLAQMLAKRGELQSEIDFMKRKGMGNRHQIMRNTVSALETLEADIEEFVRGLRGNPDGTWEAGGPGGETIPPLMALRNKEARLEDKYEDAKAKAQHMANIYSQMQVINDDLKRRTEELASTNKEIESIVIEGKAAGRAQIISNGTLPSKPYNTGKRKQLAALGGMAGLCAGFGLVIVWGLMDRRLRHVEDAQTSLGNVRMLGVLPELPEDLTDPEQAVLASHCVHQVRTLLQINRGSDGYILSVTGPAAGSGKTSLTMALGMSFASSGSKTLLIDCDIVGGGLTRRLVDRNSGGKPKGVLEACNGTAFSDCVIDTAIPNLSILPIGSALPSQAGDLSPAAVRKLLAKARDEYETVLVDTGPVLGSLEAAMVSAQADKTIVIISRGDQKPIVTKSLNHLRSIGADIAGIVFNHADAVDIERSTYASVTVSQNRRQEDHDLNEVKWIDRDTSNRYGPLATAVASYGRRDNSEHHDG